MRNLLKNFAFFLTLVSSVPSAQAGVFNLTQFVDYQSWAVGMEPEITFTDGGGFATNFKFTYGITPLNNIQATVGFGSGARQFRIGGAYSFDVVPDLDGQIGFGFYLQGLYYKRRAAIGNTEVTLTPYIHNAFQSAGGTDFDPYLAVPFGMSFMSGTYTTVVQLAVGSYFPLSQHFGFNVEAGFSLKDTDSYVSFGATYRD